MEIDRNAAMEGEIYSSPSVEVDMEYFDNLPRIIRDAMNYSTDNFSAKEASEVLAEEDTRERLALQICPHLVTILISLRNGSTINRRTAFRSRTRSKQMTYSPWI